MTGYGAMLWAWAIILNGTELVAVGLLLLEVISGTTEEQYPKLKWGGYLQYGFWAAVAIICTVISYTCRETVPCANTYIAFLTISSFFIAVYILTVVIVLSKKAEGKSEQYSKDNIKAIKRIRSFTIVLTVAKAVFMIYLVLRQNVPTVTFEPYIAYLLTEVPNTMAYFTCLFMFGTKKFCGAKSKKTSE